MPAYSLAIYNPIKLGKGYLEDLTDKALGWERSIRMQGGYWLGSFMLRENRGYCIDFLYTMLGAHIEEHAAAMVSWEGMINEMSLKAQPEYGSDIYELEVSVMGYVHLMNWRKSVWNIGINTATVILTDYVTTQVDTDFVTSYNIATNAIAANQGHADIKVWDKILEITNMGDANYNLYRSYMTRGNKFVYEQVSPTPLYYHAGGMGLRVSLEDLINYIDGICDVTQDTTSQARYGKKELNLNKGNVAKYHANQLAQMKLRENAFPQPKPFGWAPVILYSDAGMVDQSNPYLVQPAVCRDLTYPIAMPRTSYFFQDARDFIAEEITVNNLGQLFIKTKYTRPEDWMTFARDYRAPTIPGNKYIYFGSQMSDAQLAAWFDTVGMNFGGLYSVHRSDI